MYQYIDRMLSELPTVMNGCIKTPAKGDLFSVNLDEKKFPKSTAQIFPYLVQTAVAFLCTRVQAPDDDDYKKLTMHRVCWINKIMA